MTKVNVTTHIPEHDPAVAIIRAYSKQTGTPVAQIARDALRAYALHLKQYLAPGTDPAWGIDLTKHTVPARKGGDQ